MTRGVGSEDSPELMGSAEIASLLGVSRQRVQQLVNTPGFPAPVATLAMGKVWPGQAVRKWAQTRKPD